MLNNNKEDITIPVIENEIIVENVDQTKNSSTEEINDIQIAKTSSNNNISITKPAGNVDPKLQRELSIAYVDCFLAFRALCKLSTKALTPSSPVDSVDMRRKLLALELLQNILENVGPMLKENQQFIQTAIKKYLINSLLSNGVSPYIRIFRVSLNVFNALINGFKDHLKQEIGVFFSKILLRILGSAHSSVQHKHCVLLLLQKVCRQAQTLVDMFLNYDCNMESVDIFERMVNELSSIAKGISTADNSISYTTTIRILALDCLVTIMKSLVQWSSELIDEESTKKIERKLSTQHNEIINKKNSKNNLHDSTDSTDNNMNMDADASQSPIDSFTQQKQKKYQLARGKKLFNNNKPKKGIDYLIENGHIKNDPEDVASFLLHSDGLDLTQIGQYLGLISDPFCKNVLYAYVDLQRFENMEIYTALRRFLLGFRLPGEGQQIDVIMEKFAERYYHDNCKKISTQEESNSSSKQSHQEEKQEEQEQQQQQQQDNENQKQEQQENGNTTNDDDTTTNHTNTTNDDDDNGFIFKNADAVYIFAYHMIMLATDLHHPSVKKKLTKQEWINNNRGLNDGKDFPKEFLLKIYDTILQNPLKTRDDPKHQQSNIHGVSDELLTPKQRQILFLKETKSIVQRSQELIQEKLDDKSTFFKSTNIEHVKPMFYMSWCPMLAAFSMNLEVSQDHEKDIYSLCLEGFRSAIRVSSIFYMETERNAFISSLYQFTLLTNLREMKKKNIEAIKCLIQIAHEDGNYLQSSWTQVLNCISQLAKMQILGSSMRHTEHIPSSTPTPKSLSDTQQITSSLTKSSQNNNILFFNTQSNSTLITNNIEGINASAVVDQIDLSEIDRIFSNTVNLHDNAIVEFVKCLCETTLLEVSPQRNSEQPRTFSLQKLIEVAYYNMERIRFVWTRIWGIMANHFKSIGCHSNLKVAMYAVDSLRQLAMKFLEKDELANYHFQKDFLKPFEYIVVHNKNIQVRELVVNCLSQMILARATNIRSGWKSIFMVFTFVATHSQQSIVFLAYLMQDKIITDYFSLIASTFFVECVECLTAFASNIYFKEVGVKAVESIGFCAQQLIEGDDFSFIKNFHLQQQQQQQQLQHDDDNNTNNSNDYPFTTDENHLIHWLPILIGLSKVIHHPNIDVRTSAVDRLFNILLKYGKYFSPNLWDLIYSKILLSLFTSIFDTTSKSQGQLGDTSEWVTTTCLSTISHMIELFSYFFDCIHFLTEKFLILLTRFVLQENFHLSSIGSKCLEQFISSNTTSWSQKQWTFISLTVQYIIKNKLCTELLSIGQPKNTNVIVPSDDDDDDNNTDTQLDNDENSISPNFLTPKEEKQFLDLLIQNTPVKHRPLEIKIVVGKCNVLLLLLKSIREILSSCYELISNQHFAIFLDTLDSCYQFTFALNNKPSVWKATGESDIMSLMVRQESDSCDIYLDILFRLYADSKVERENFARDMLLKFVVFLFFF